MSSRPSVPSSGSLPSAGGLLSTGIFPPAGIFLLVFAVYGWTASDAVRLDDSAWLLLTCEQPGIAHPPGYPLYTLLCHAWLRVWPFGALPLQLALFSAFCGAGACVVVGWIALRVTRGDRTAAAVAALGYAFSRVHWYTSVTHEVYALGELLSFACLACVLRGRDGGGPRSWLAAAGLLGLAASNHLPLVALVVPGLAIVAWPARAQLAAMAPRLVAAVAAGLLPYSYLWLRSQSPDGLYAFLGPIDDVGAFLAYVTRSVYDFPGGSGGGLEGRLCLQLALAREIALQLTPLGVAGAALGVWRGFVDGDPDRATTVGLGVVFLAPTVGLWGLHDEASDLTVATLRVFPGIAYGVMAIFLAVGVAWLRARLAPRRPALAAGCAAAFVAGLLYCNGPANDFRGDRFAERHARAILDALPADAVLFEGADFASNAIEVLHAQDGLRPDVALYNVQGVMLPDRLFAPLTPAPERDAFLRRWIAEQSRPVYYASVVEPPWGFEELGLLRRVVPGRPVGEVTYDLPPSVRRWLEGALERGTDDPLERLVLARATQFVSRSVTHLVEIAGRSDPELRALHARLAGHYYAELGALEVYTRAAGQGEAADAERFAAHYRAALAAEPHAGRPGRSERSLLRYMAAYFHYRTGAPERARPLAEEALALWPHNGGARELLRALGPPR